jgi:UPF0755 protein
MAKKKRKIGIFKKTVIVFLLLIIAGGAWIGSNYYKKIFKPNVQLGTKKTAYVYIPTGSTLSDVSRILRENHFIIDNASFEWLAEKFNYKYNIRPGKYLIKNKMSNEALIKLLRSGQQMPVRVLFHHTRTKQQLAGKIGAQIEADSLDILRLLNDREYLKKFGLTKENSVMIFIPNTYEFYWNTSAEELMERMAKEYKTFWTEERKQKAAKNGFSQTEVAVLASIVQEETSRSDEKPIVAGVYVNRYKKGMLLQADPTLIFAVGDFSIRRVLNVHKEIESPYNTYKYKGLPPGPICIPAISSIDAVLNYQHHDYLYFCAKEDFSGYHNFAKTFAQHMVNARKFQRELNKRKIMN